jgi:ribonuclease T1
LYPAAIASMSIIRQGVSLLLSGLTCWGIGTVSPHSLAQTSTSSLLAKQTPAVTIPIVPLTKLPVEAKTTLELIKKGGPFPYPQKDGTVFGNRERRLPTAARGYYREYTVPTPGIRHRGARRIVTGQQQEYYYTGDHYQSFVRIKQP